MISFLAQVNTDPVMTGGSWAFMLTAWACVIGLVTWCFWRVLGGGPKT